MQILKKKKHFLFFILQYESILDPTYISTADMYLNKTNLIRIIYNLITIQSSLDISLWCLSKTNKTFTYISHNSNFECTNNFAFR